MKHYLSILLFLLMIPLCSNAQWHYRFPLVHKEKTQKTASFVKQYGDSLMALSKRIFNAPANKKAEAAADEPRIFMPLTFYHDVVGRAFNVGDTLSFTDRLLLRTYIMHPDLVESSQTEIEKALAQT